MPGWRDKLAVMQEWTSVERACVPAIMPGLFYLQYFCWALFVLTHDDYRGLVNESWLWLQLPVSVAMMILSVALLLAGLRLNRRKPDAVGFQLVTTLFYAISLVWGGYLIGTLSLTIALVMTAAPLVGFLLIDRRVMLASIAVAFTGLLGLTLAAAWDVIPYAPLLLAPTDAASARLWTDTQLFFALPHLAINTFMCAMLLDQWRRREARVISLSLTDVLTQVHNRRSILSLLDKELALSRRNGGDLAIALLDLDHFKRINDTWGHPVGDRVLQAAATSLHEALRLTDAVGRFGGEEFLMVLPHTGAAAVGTLLERCRERLAALELYADNGERIPVTASFGYACHDGRPELDADALLQAADSALYAAKQAGRNCVQAAAFPTLGATAGAVSRDAASTTPGTVTASTAPGAVTTAATASTATTAMPTPPPGQVHLRRHAPPQRDRGWWRSLRGWRRAAATVQEWSPAARSALVMGLLLPMQWGVLLMLLGLLAWPGSRALLDVEFTRQCVWVLAAQIAAAHALLGVALRARERAPTSAWLQQTCIYYYSLSMVSIAYAMGTLFLPMGGILTSSPMIGFILFAPRVVLPAFISAVVAVLGLTYAAALGWLPYAPLLAGSPPWQLHSPFWVLCNYLLYVPVLAVTLWLADQVFGHWRQREAHVHAMSLTDALTGLHNRRSALAQLDKEIARTWRHGPPLAVVILDLDHFKRINDTWGHPVGDRVLQATAQVLGATIRQCDTAGRFGGEEFLLLLPDTTLDGALVLAERCRNRLTDMLVVTDTGEPLRVSASFGVVSNEKNMALDAECLVKAADDALYRAKQHGRNRVEALTLGDGDEPPLQQSA